MKITRARLKQIIKEEMSRLALKEGKGVSPMIAKGIFNRLKDQGGNRSLTNDDESNAQNYITNNWKNWSSEREAKDALIRWLVKNRFGNRVDYSDYR
jgi:hypothetical protein